MKAMGKEQTAPLRKSKFKREEASPGVWRYNDPDESSFVLACIASCGVDISEIDDFIDGFKHAITTDCDGQSAVGEPVVLSTEIIEALLERRQDAFDAFKAGNDDLLDARLDALSGWCYFVGFRAAAQPEITMATNYRKRQSGARNGLPGTADDPDAIARKMRNGRIYARYKKLTDKTNTEYTTSPTQQLAVDFELTERQIRRIVAAERETETEAARSGRT